ncbi:MAG: HAMP domain-containing sensor histidine kinase [Firmicutes bacterium]|nr:HAMP domain-containing sensor histidine kinase [Bacillota bacterium]
MTRTAPDMLSEELKMWFHALGLADESVANANHAAQAALDCGSASSGGSVSLKLTGSVDSWNADRVMQGMAELARMAFRQQWTLWTLVHEVRNPLSVMLAQVELLSREIGAHPRLESLARAIERIDRQLQAATGAPARSWSTFALAEALEPILTDLAPLAETKRLRWLIAVKGVSATWDQEAFWHIAFNLVKNAIEAAPVRGVVEVGADDDEHGARFWVKTPGVVIPPHVRSRLFSEPTSVKGPQRGLGLMLCRNLARELEAELSYTEDRGFVLAFPSKTSRQKSCKNDP